MQPSTIPHVAADALVGMIAPKSAALLVIDVQQDFAGPAGAAARRGAALDPIESAIDRMEPVIAAARRVGMTIVFIRVVSRPETDSPALKQLFARKGRPEAALAMCRAGTPGADYYRLVPMAGDIEIEKPLFSSFHATELDATLRDRGIDTLLVMGVTTDCCVESTVRDAFHRNYNVFVVSDACAAYTPDLHDGALSGMEKNCALLVSARTLVGIL